MSGRQPIFAHAAGFLVRSDRFTLSRSFRFGPKSTVLSAPKGLSRSKSTWPTRKPRLDPEPYRSCQRCAGSVRATPFSIFFVVAGWFFPFCSSSVSHQRFRQDCFSFSISRSLWSGKIFLVSNGTSFCLRPDFSRFFSRLGSFAGCRSAFGCAVSPQVFALQTHVHVRRGEADQRR